MKKISEINAKHKVFLGGTCCKTTWRDKIIPKLTINYFNPVVEDWTPECIEEEYRQKNDLCDIHLYVITPQLKGVFSIAEIIQSCNTKDKTTVLYIMEKDEDDNSTWSKEMSKSLSEVSNLAQTDGAIICTSLDDVVQKLNNLN